MSNEVSNEVSNAVSNRVANLAVSINPDAALSRLLNDGLRGLGLMISPEQQQQLLQYVALLNKWNKTYNLTAVRDMERMIGVHILDSLAVLPHLGRASTMLDVGSGGGLPGIPLAIVLAQSRPELHITMLDSLQKKTVFMRQAISELGLKNASVEWVRVENFQPAQPFDIVISRAFAELADFVAGAGHLLAAGGRLLAMKGTAANEEISRFQAINASNAAPALALTVKNAQSTAPALVFEVNDIVELKVPQVDGERYLVTLELVTHEKIEAPLN